jgi:hypothetical protein
MTTWDLYEKGELVCIGYGKPSEGLVTTREDRKTAYLIESQSEVEKDPAAAALLQQYLGEAEVEKGMDVFCFDQVDAPTKPKKSNRAKKPYHAGKMSRKVSLLNQRARSEDVWPQGPLGKHRPRSAPAVPITPRQQMMQEKLSVNTGLTAATDKATEPATATSNAESVLLGKKYKPVADKIKPILGQLPAKFRIQRNITGDPLKDMPTLNPHPPDFVPTDRYTAER